MYTIITSDMSNQNVERETARQRERDSEIKRAISSYIMSRLRSYHTIGKEYVGSVGRERLDIILSLLFLISFFYYFFFSFSSYSSSFLSFFLFFVLFFFFFSSRVALLSAQSSNQLSQHQPLSVTWLI